MLKSRTAYPITKTNTHILGIISGLGRQTMDVSIGWYATFSEQRVPRWRIQPPISLEEDFEIDKDSYP